MPYDEDGGMGADGPTGAAAVLHIWVNSHFYKSAYLSIHNDKTIPFSLAM